MILIFYSPSGVIPIILNMQSYYSGWVESAATADCVSETVDLETETGCVYLVHDNPETTKRDFDLLMFIEERYPDLLHSNAPLFLAPEDDSKLTPEILDILNRDTETLILDIISSYKDGSEGKPIVPEELLMANPYNLENVEGSMVGVYCPPYMTSLNSAGWHFHFVTADRDQGGHVLDCQVGKATASIDLTKEFDLALPGSEKFESTDFTVDRSADVKKAETNE